MWYLTRLNLILDTGNFHGDLLDSIVVHAAKRGGAIVVHGRMQKLGDFALTYVCKVWLELQKPHYGLALCFVCHAH